MDLTHHFLVSMPQMRDSFFQSSVVYVLEHNDQGAFGVIINDELDMSIESLLSEVDIELRNNEARETIVLRGGPVDQSHGLVLHEAGPSFSATHNFEHGVSLSSSRDILEAIASGGEGEPDNFLIVLGHSGWAPGQLEMEVAANAWLTCEADSDIIFKTPAHQRREAAASLIGVNLSSVVGHTGHA